MEDGREEDGEKVCVAMEDYREEGGDGGMCSGGEGGGKGASELIINLQRDPIPLGRMKYPSNLPFNSR